MLDIPHPSAAPHQLAIEVAARAAYNLALMTGTTPVRAQVLHLTATIQALRELDPRATADVVKAAEAMTDAARDPEPLHEDIQAIADAQRDASDRLERALMERGAARAMARPARSDL